MLRNEQWESAWVDRPTNGKHQNLDEKICKKMVTVLFDNQDNVRYYNLLTSSIPMAEKCI